MTYLSTRVIEANLVLSQATRRALSAGTTLIPATDAGCPVSMLTRRTLIRNTKTHLSPLWCVHLDDTPCRGDNTGFTVR